MNKTTNEKDKKPAENKPTDDKEKLLNEYKEHLQRLQAEFDNYRKRVEKEKEEFCKIASHEIIYKLLGILDSFEFALQSKDKNQDFVKGIELIYSQLYSMLEKDGLKKIESLNKKFDADYHEVLLIEEHNDMEEDIVIEELQKGYMLNEKVLRHAKVKISKKSKEEK